LCDESSAVGRKFPTLAKLPRDGSARIYPPEFEGAFQALPLRSRPHPKAAAYTAWHRYAVREVEEPFQLEAAALAYAEQMEADGDVGKKFVYMASTFFGPGEPWEPYSGIEPTPPVPAPEPAPGGGFYAA